MIFCREEVYGYLMLIRKKVKSIFKNYFFFRHMLSAWEGIAFCFRDLLAKFMSPCLISVTCWQSKYNMTQDNFRDLKGPILFQMLVSPVP